MAETVVLAFPDFSKEFIVHLDASAYAVGATISQYEADMNLRLITCMSRKMNYAQNNYSTHERELLALVLCLKQWRHYLLGPKVIASIDNVSLKYLKTQASLTPRQVRWIAEIERIWSRIETLLF